MKRIHQIFSSPGWRLGSRFLLVALLSGASLAEARVETVVWSQANMSNVRGWKIHVGASSRNYTTIVDAGLPTRDGDGAYRFDVTVAGDDDVFLAMTSYNDSLEESVLSNERLRSVGATTPPDEVDPPPGSGGASYYINAGGPSAIVAEGKTWIADDSFASVGTPKTTNVAIADTTADALYQTERWGGEMGGAPMTYQFAVENGAYTVRLHFAETYYKITEAGTRLFDVVIEGTTRLADLDVFAEVGANRALVKVFTVDVNDGQLSIDFVRRTTQTPTIKAIEVTGGPAGAPLAPRMLPQN